MQWSAEFYKALFDESFRKIEPAWLADESYAPGCRWTNHRGPFREEFRIETLQEGQLLFLFAVWLPEIYRDTEIYSEFEKFHSRLQLSLTQKNGSLRLTAALRAGSERESLMEFIHLARKEFTGILGSVVLKAKDVRNRSPKTHVK